jgi:hypothetical protein
VRAMLLTLLACVLMSCMSAPREREAHCLAAIMTDLWQTEQDLTAAEDDWRRARQDRPSSDRASSAVVLLADFDVRSQRVERSVDDAFYRRIVDARARHGETTKWYGLVARRVQTRMEEDDMLYPVLGMLATSTAIVLYPLVRWNVRSVLWDGIDPDAEDDPVQRFCAARLGQENHYPKP